MRLTTKLTLSTSRLLFAGALCAFVSSAAPTTQASLSGRADGAVTGAYPADLNLRGVARGKVDIEGGLQAVAWDGTGVVKRVLVSEGDQVAAGAPLAELDRQGQRYAVEHAAANLRLAQSARTLISAQLPYARTLERRLKKGVAAGGIDAQRLSEAQEKLNILTLQLAGAQAGIDAAMQALNTATWEFERRLLRAHDAGQIVGVHARVGQTLSSHPSALFSVMPEKPRYVRAEVNEYFIDAITPGMRAFVSQDLTGSRSEQAVEGTVVRVAPIFRAGVLDEPSEHGNTRVVDVIVSLPITSDLKLGQPVKVKFYD